MTSYIPKSRQYRGSDLTGTDATTGRTVSLESTSILDGMTISINGASLHYGASADYTFAAGVITFNNVIFNTDYIDISYFYTTGTATSSTSAYCAVSDVMDYLNYTKEVPDYDNQVNTKETLSGTTALGYFLAHNKVIASTYTFYYGATESTSTPLIETTEYTIDLDKGYLTLTSTGKTTVGTNNVYGAYKYNSNFKNSMVTDIINSNTNLIDSILHMTYCSPTVAFREEQPGKGAYYRMYWMDKFPKLPFVGSLNGAVTTTATTFILDDTTGLMAGDYMTIESEVIYVVSVDSGTNLTVTRGVLGTSAVIHADEVFLCNYVVEICNTPLGGQPLWHILTFRSNFEVDRISGAIQLLHVNAEDKDALASDLYPPQRIFNRIRVIYKYGATAVPVDIKRLCILMTVRQLYQSMIANAISRGINGFKPEGMSMIDNEIKMIIKQNIRLMMDGF